MAIIELPRVGKAATSAGIRKIAIEEHVMGTLFATSESYAQHSSRVNGVGGKFIEMAAQRLADMTSIRLEEMDAADIDVSILSLTGPGIEEMVDPRAAIDASRRVNDFLAEHIEASGGRFEAFAAVPLQDVDAAIAELRRAVDKLGLKGVLVNGYVGNGTDGKGQYLDEPQFDPFWKALSELHVPLYLHPRAPDKLVQEVMYRGHPELIGATWGFAPETATHALRLAYGGVFDRHPGASVILGHMGETLPFFASRIQRAFEYNNYGKTPAKRLQDYLSENFWVTTSGNLSDQALVTALLTVGSDRILFASDYPFDMATDAARWIERAPISESDRRKICYKNAEALFAIAPQRVTRA
jgi:predicted TIM-barrel fold metal-dependent hydrolase